jgi:methoxymalonate biosynthesis protein
VNPVKCVIWDLDGTLWRGTLAESDRVELTDEVRTVITGLDERGILQSVCSRNDHDHAWRTLRALGVADYFIQPRIGWGPKSAGVREIVDHLGFAEQAFAFVDDHPVERAEVAHHLPGVRCYPAEAVPDLLARPEFDPPRTAVSARRRQYLLAEERRAAARADDGATDEEFLRSLDAELAVDPATADDLARLAELTVRTTRLNTTGVPYTDDDLSAWRASPDHDVLVARLDDRFGGYGEIGVLLVHRRPGVWRLVLLATSCRVLAHGVGTTLLRWLMDRAHRAGVHLVADFRRTDRNRQMAVAYRFAGLTEDPCDCQAALPPPSAGVRHLHVVPGPQEPPRTVLLRVHPSLRGCGQEG